MSDYVLKAQGLFINVSPDAFHMWATHYFKCQRDFQCPDSFSPVPYFLLCRAIELELKSRHLIDKRQPEVKDSYGHNLLASYHDLPDSDRILTDEELVVLNQANEIYKAKGFEYFRPDHALMGYSNFPDLTTLEAIAKRLLSL
jgi:hypothetical protein